MTRDTINSYTTRVEKSCVKKKKKELIINLQRFSAENNEIQLKVFSNCIKYISKSYYPPRAKKIENLLNRAKFEKKLKATLGGCIIQKNQNSLIIQKEELKKGLKF